jgi:hypothetical protein
LGYERRTIPSMLYTAKCFWRGVNEDALRLAARPTLASSTASRGRDSRGDSDQMTGASRAASLLATSGALLALGVLWLASSARAYSTNPHIAAFVQVFSSGTPAEVRCPVSLDEWSFDLGDPLNAEDVYGRTFTRTEVVEFRSDLCTILDNLADSSADDSTKALAVLTLVHESYHVRRWRWRLNEAHVECQAIRHFRVGVRVLGGSQQLADRLFPLGLSWHNQIARNPSYNLSSCEVPQ